MNTKRIEPLLQNVILDLQNPRHGDKDSEQEVIAELLAKFKVAELASDIAERGLNAIEGLAFLQHPKDKTKYIVVEGNRRCCALKLLQDPRRAPAIYRDHFERLKKSNGYTPPKKLYGVLFESPEEAVQWKANRHEGQQDGRGLLPWGIDAKQRNASAYGKKLYAHLALQLRDYGRANGLISDEIAEKIPVSTLSRYLNTTAVRAALGITPGGQLEFDRSRSPADRNALVKAFLLDAIPTRDQDGGKSKPVLSSRSDSDERNTYAVELPKRIASGSLHSVEATQLVESGKEKVAATRSVLAERGKRVMPSSFRPQVPANAVLLKRIMKELRDLDADEFRLSATYLLRALLETTTKDYLRHQKIAFASGTELHSLMLKAADHAIESAGDDKARKRDVERKMKAYRAAASSTQSTDSPDSLGHAVHGGKIYTLADLKGVFSNHQPAFAILLDALSKAPVAKSGPGA